MSNYLTSKKKLALKSAIFTIVAIAITLVSCVPEGPQPPAQIQPNFRAGLVDVNSAGIQIYEGDSVLFINESTNAFSYIWTFYGGSPSSSNLESPPYIVYNTPGTYDVVLNAFDNIGNNENKEKTGYITVLADTTPASCGTTVSDIDGNTYNVVQIGNQCWMQENLKTTTYNDGTPIPTGLTDGEWDIATTGAYSIYQDNSANDAIHGKLYNWYAVETGKLCPQGWHIPTKAEFETLINSVGGSSAGGSLKSTTLWDVPNVGATNSSGFTAFASGSRLETFWGYFGLGSDGRFWSTTENFDGGAEQMYLSTYETTVALESYPKLNGLSCRCVKD